MTNKFLSDIAEFQTSILNNQFPSKPTFDQEKAMHLTLCAQEELDELTLAVEQGDFPETVDAIIDCIYFLLGGLHQLGVPAERAWDAVHHANMTKLRGVTKRGVEGDAAKPSGWKPPDHSWVNGEKTDAA
jgi:predicted HAD superfamily Cof-like phosphohydrolase